MPTCALVSNGALLTGKGLGPKIDANSYVLRLNNAPTEGYEVISLATRPARPAPPPPLPLSP